MPFDSCDPCCDPAAAARDNGTFKQAVLLLLCQIAQPTFAFCDGDGNPVIVKYSYDTAGVPTFVSAYYLDGTEYVGAVGDLTFCGVTPT